MSNDYTRQPLCPCCGDRIRACPIWVKTCTVCSKLFVARVENRVTCRGECSLRWRNKSNARTRWKATLRRGAERSTDITRQQADEMRRRTRKCTLCGIFMTNKPSQPNSKHLDHIVPLNQGGTHTHGNVRIICRTCNLSRPRDGSDYTGQVTLWATVPGFIAKPKPTPKVKPMRPQRLQKVCGCGNSFTAIGGASRCHDCLVLLGRQAAKLRADGLKWQDIADHLGYSSPGALYTYAKMYGEAS